MRSLYIPSMNRYGFGLGLVQFRHTVAAWMKKRFNLTFDPLKVLAADNQKALLPPPGESPHVNQRNLAHRPRRGSAPHPPNSRNNRLGNQPATRHAEDDTGKAVRLVEA